MTRGINAIVGKAAVSRIFLSPLLIRVLLYQDLIHMGQILSLKCKPLFWKELCVQRTKQKVTKVVFEKWQKLPLCVFISLIFVSGITHNPVKNEQYAILSTRGMNTLCKFVNLFFFFFFQKETYAVILYIKALFITGATLNRMNLLCREPPGNTFFPFRVGLSSFFFLVDLRQNHVSFSCLLCNSIHSL